MVEEESEEVIQQESIPSIASTEAVDGSAQGGKKETARQRIAMIYVVGFLLISTISLLTVFFKPEYNVNDTKDLLVTVSGILSGPLGFIIGYYFKAGEDK